MADRVERLTNLLALLLETNEPLSLVEIAAELDGQYPDQDGARRQAFERDKSALRELGIPIDTEILAGGPYAGQTRYRIERRKYELADLDLDADEMHALQVAVAAVRTGSGSGQSAIWKLGGALDEERPPVSASVPDRPELPVLRAAVASRSTSSSAIGATPVASIRGACSCAAASGTSSATTTIATNSARSASTASTAESSGITVGAVRFVRAPAVVRSPVGVPGRPEADRSGSRRLGRCDGVDRRASGAGGRA